VTRHEWKTMPQIRREDDDQFFDRIQDMTFCSSNAVLCSDCGAIHEQKWCPRCSSTSFEYVQTLMRRQG
jgi:hypothetical protein